MKILSKTFQENSKVRIIVINNKEWFVAKDTALLLSYKDTKKAIQQHCKKPQYLNDLVEGGNLSPSDFQEGFGNSWKQLKVIPESDVWRLIIKSTLPEAEKIEEWIFEEVLPEIRKTGSYSLQKKEVEKETQQTSLEIVENGIQLLTKLRDLNPLEQIELDTFHKNKNGESLLEQFGKSFENSYFLPTELGKFSGQSGSEINLILEKKGFQLRDEKGVWKPTSSGKEFCLEIGNQFNQLKWKLDTIF
jgi:prophage antirepressor-like protein